MARKKQQLGFDANAFMQALAENSEETNINENELMDVLKHAFVKAYVEMQKFPSAKETGGLTDPVFELDIENDKFESFNSLHLYQIKEVKNDDDITDDELEISLEDAKELSSAYQLGDKAKIEITNFVEEYTDNEQYIRKFVNNFHSKLREVNKTKMFELFSKRIGQLLVGEVERIDGEFITLNFGNNTTGILRKKDITTSDKEKLSIGDNIRVYLKGVDLKGTTPQLSISRTCEGFVAKIFEEEIHDVQDGTVIIKKIARDAGKKTKVAVISNDPNVNPVGSCIGANSKRIQNISGQLSGELIDVFQYSENSGLLIAEALKPATVIGLSLDEEQKVGTVIVKNEEKKLAIGKTGVNVRLASIISGYKLQIKEIDEALEEKLTYTSIEDIKRSIFGEKEEEEIEYEDEEEEEEIENVVVPEKEVVVEVKKEPVNETPVSNETIEVKEETIEQPVKEEVIEKIEIKGKAKVSIEDLEKQIDKERNKQVTSQKKYRRDDKPLVDDKDENKVNIKPENVMPIYTEEELEKMKLEEEENSSVEDDSKYDDYDDDTYYE